MLKTLLELAEKVPLRVYLAALYAVSTIVVASTEP